MIKIFLTTIGLLIAFVSCSETEINIQKSKKPNIIYILADDMGYADVGCYGSQFIKTPILDKMATEGMRFTQHYAGSTVCAPSRGTLMTGLHTGHGYIKGNFAMTSEGNLPLPAETITVAEILQSKGYKTGVIGKWGLGGPTDEGHPNRQGFDYSFCFLDQRLAHEYYPDHLWRNFDKVLLNSNGTHKDYSHDLFTKDALRFISNNKTNPFFLYLPYTIPHGKYQVPDNSLYADKPWTATQKNYAAMISRMDGDIGKIFAQLDSLQLSENTIVFFTSDNGAVKGMANFFGSNQPFRGYKTDLYEGGIREPLIVKWPGKITPGTISDHISAFWDFLPTVCDLVGATPPANIDGISFLPEILGQTQAKHEFLVWEYFGYNYGWKSGSSQPRNFLQHLAVRMGDWKGVRQNIKKNPNAPLELYDLKNDPSEHNNVAAQYPEVVKQIEKIMENENTDSEFFKK